MISAVDFGTMEPNSPATAFRLRRGRRTRNIRRADTFGIPGITARILSTRNEGHLSMPN